MKETSTGSPPVTSRIHVMQGLLFGVAPHDPSTFIGVTVMMAAIGLVACWIPALRAARIDPAIAIRAE